MFFGVLWWCYLSMVLFFGLLGLYNGMEVGDLMLIFFFFKVGWIL